MAKNDLPDKSTGEQLLASDWNTVKNVQNDNDDLITTAQTTADNAATAAANAQSTATTADGKADTAISNAATAQTTADGKADLVTTDIALTDTFTIPENGIRFPKVIGGDWTLEVDGSSAQYGFAELVIDQPSSLTLGASWVAEGGSQPIPDTSQEITIFLRKTPSRVYYIISNNVSNTDITGPTIQGNAVVENANPADFVFTFNEAVSVTNLNDISFTGDMAALTPQSFALSNGNQTLTITADGNVQAGESGTVVFGAGNTITDTSGNPMLADTVSVTNNVGGDVTAPTISSATVDVAGTSLTVVFSEVVTGTNTGLSFDGTLAGTIGSPTGSGTDTFVFPITGGPVLQGQSGNLVVSSSDIVDGASNGLADTTEAVTNNSTQAAPVLQAAETDSAGTTVTLTYNEALDTGSVPAAGDFTVSPTRAISNVGVTGTTVTFDVDVFYDDDDVITVSYVPGVNPIQDGAGNAAAALTNESVTNNSTVVAWVFNRSRDNTALEFNSTTNTRTIPLNSTDFSGGMWFRSGNFDPATDDIDAIRTDVSDPSNNRTKFSWVAAFSAWSLTIGNTDGDNYRWRFATDESEFDDAWHFICWSYDYNYSNISDAVTMWLDGVELTLSSELETGTFDKDLCTENNINYLGLAESTGGGYAGDMFIETTELTQTQVNALYNSGIPVDFRTVLSPEVYINYGDESLNELSGNSDTLSNATGTLVYSTSVP